MRDEPRHRENLAWVAGFWDGEGCVSSLNNTYSTNYPVFAITQAGDEAPALLQRVLDAVGLRGRVTGPYAVKGAPNRKPKYSLRISGYERVQAVTAMCWPWLSETKKEQATRVLAAYHAVRPVKPLRTHCPKCGCEWKEPNIAYHVGARSWRCRVCRRKNPDVAKPAMHHPRTRHDVDMTGREPRTRGQQRYVHTRERSAL